MIDLDSFFAYNISIDINTNTGSKQRQNTKHQRQLQTAHKACPPDVMDRGKSGDFGNHTRKAVMPVIMLLSRYSVFQIKSNN